MCLQPSAANLVAPTLDREAVQAPEGEVQLPRLAMPATRGSSSVLGASVAMQMVFDVIDRVAPTSATVLISGESGTGKELIARAIHDKSPRRGGPFVAINCAAVPASLLESEFFGHAKGAFTDARSARRGLFLEADGGTLFLDEIGEMPIEMQVKLLRALQERRVRAVGGNTEAAFDARIIAATNRDLEQDVAAKRFREDLYYRINVCAVSLPPLRDRNGDVALLAQAFLARFAQKYDKAVTGLAADALAKLVDYPWPGNVRELENGIESAVAMARQQQLELDDLPARVRAAPRAPTSAIHALVPASPARLVSLREHEHLYLQHVLSVLKGNKSAAAAVLGFDRRTLHRKLKEMRTAAGGEHDTTH